MYCIKFSNFLIHFNVNIFYLFFVTNFIEDITPTDQNITEQQSNGKFILLNLYMIT